MWEDVRGPVLWQFAEWLAANPPDLADGGAADDAEAAAAAAHAAESKATEPPPEFWGVAGEPSLRDKSRFLSHAARARTLADVRAFRAALMRERVVSGSTHNIAAWLLSSGECNYDDDGETGAGKRLVALLQRMDAADVVVVVTRWYGGVHLGPARFRMINASAMSAVNRVREGER